MDKEKIENPIKLLKEQKSEDQSFNKTCDLCIICNRNFENVCKLLCECVFCWNCLEKYLDNDDDKCCPGRSESCKDQILSIGNNVFMNQSNNSEISRIIVKYPDQASISIEEYMKDRNLSRKVKTHKCPYFNMGCDCEKLTKDELGKHIETEQNLHTKLLIGCIDMLKSELNIVKTEMQKSKSENEQLKMEIDILKQESRENQDLIYNLQVSDQEKTEQIDYLMQYIPESNEEVFIENKSSAFVGDGEGNQMKKVLDSINKKIVNINHKVNKLEANFDTQNYGEFIWKIENFSAKINQARRETNLEIYSDSFFTHKNGYKMCLRLDPSGMNVGKRSHLALYFCIVQGPFDNILPWPMKHAVTFTLINQETGKVYTSRTARYDDFPDNFAWNKPTSDKKIGYGYHKFAELDEILNNPSLCRGDRIFLKCTVDNLL